MTKNEKFNMLMNLMKYCNDSDTPLNDLARDDLMVKFAKDVIAKRNSINKENAYKAMRERAYNLANITTDRLNSKIRANNADNVLRPTIPNNPMQNDIANKNYVFGNTAIPAHKMYKATIDDFIAYIIDHFDTSKSLSTIIHGPVGDVINNIVEGYFLASRNINKNNSDHDGCDTCPDKEECVRELAEDTDNNTPEQNDPNTINTDNNFALFDITFINNDGVHMKTFAYLNDKYAYLLLHDGKFAPEKIPVSDVIEATMVEPLVAKKIIEFLTK